MSNLFFITDWETIFKKGSISVNAYFPNDTWYDYYTGEVVANNGYVSLDAPLDKINVHVRAGYIVPYQYPDLTTKAR